MQKQSGVHFYVNIMNYNAIIVDEENRTHGVTHAIHALDTFFTSIEKYGKKVSNTLVVEKITGSRLHLYVVDDLIPAFDTVMKVSGYAEKLSRYLKTDIGKYKTLKDFHINVGADYGDFYEFEFVTHEGYSELTTIGFVANFAAKLQALAGCGKVSISEKIYNALSPDKKRLFEMIDENSIKKYGQDKYYTATITNIPSNEFEEELEAAKEYANSDNLKDIDFASVRKQLSFDEISKTQCKKLEGIPVFADVRGFTQQFDDQDFNLDEMSIKTQNILESMYRVSTQHGGVHVQFQGDRELSLYHNVPSGTYNGITIAEKKCFKAAVLASMRMIDTVKPNKVHIGIGENFGTLYATKLGARGEKDNILLGETVIVADQMEDRYANEDQIVITAEVFVGLKKEDEYLADQFKSFGGYYVATIGYDQYMRNISYRRKSEYTYW